MLTLGAWLHDLDTVAFRVGPMPFRWYGIAYISGFVAAWFILTKLARRGSARFEAERVIDIILTCVIGVLVGGRLGYVLFYDPTLLWQFTDRAPWWGLLAINEGGMSSHGGIIGVIMAGLWIARREKVRFLHVMDCLALVTPIGLGFGRLANFVNGELLGKIVAQPGEDSPWWSVKYPQELHTLHAPELTPEQMLELNDLMYSAAPAAENIGQQIDALIRAVQNHAGDFAARLEPLLAARHPTQIYQFAAEGVVLFLAMIIVWTRPKRIDGMMSAAFLIVYGALRIVTEFWRLPDDHLTVQRIAGLSRGQWLSVLMILVGIVVIIVARKRKDIGDGPKPAQARAAEPTSAAEST